MKIEDVRQIDSIDFEKGGGLVPLVAQDAGSGQVRMLGYADRRALRRTLETGEVHFFSRSRGALWRKGETSGNRLELASLHVDCDADAAIVLVRPIGPTCHTGAETCFAAPPLLPALAEVIAERATRPEHSASYTQKLLSDRNLRLKKLTEEAGELAVACADEDAAAVAEEAADLLYHALVACHATGVKLVDILAILQERFQP